MATQTTHDDDQKALGDLPDCARHEVSGSVDVVVH